MLSLQQRVCSTSWSEQELELKLECESAHDIGSTSRRSSLAGHSLPQLQATSDRRREAHPRALTPSIAATPQPSVRLTTPSSRAYNQGRLLQATGYTRLSAHVSVFAHRPHAGVLRKLQPQSRRSRPVAPASDHTAATRAYHVGARPPRDYGLIGRGITLRLDHCKINIFSLSSNFFCCPLQHCAAVPHRLRCGHTTPLVNPVQTLRRAPDRHSALHGSPLPCTTLRSCCLR